MIIILIITIRRRIRRRIKKVQIKPSETLHEKNQSTEIFYIPKIIRFYNYNFIGNKYACVCMCIKIVCVLRKVLTGAGLSRRTLWQN